MERLFHKGGAVVSLSPLQIGEGAAQGLTELTETEKLAHLAPARIVTLDSLKAAATAERKKVETGGLIVPGVGTIETGIEDQNRITSVIANAERSGLDSFDFKAASSWTKITLAELESVATAIAQHVQTCFSAERLHHEAIDALAVQYQDDSAGLQTALNAYDTSQGWPAADLREPASA